MKFLVLVLLVPSLWSAAGQSATTAESRRDATYHYPDWTKTPAPGYYDTPPVPVNGMHAFISQLSYPSDLRRRHIGGMTRVKISVDATGRLLEVKVLRSASPELDRIVVGAVRRTRWNPAMKNHSAVAAKVSFPVTFKPPP